MKACFDSMRQHKEQERYAQVFTLLNDVELVQIDQLNNEIDIIDTESKFKAKNRACQCVKTMLSKQLQTYFEQWKNSNSDYKVQLNTVVKDKIIKMYMHLMRTSFN